MRLIQTLLLVFFALGFQLVYGQNEPTDSPASALAGQWEIDLRPSPGADPYLKDFSVRFTDEKHFSGSFYDTHFENGVVNSAWENVHFAFSTKDRKNTYVTIGYFDGEVVRGTTFCENRDLVMPWTGRRKIDSKN